MKAFSFAAPRFESEVLELLGETWGQSEILAGGTDLVGLMRQMIVAPERVVYLGNVAEYRGIEADSAGVRIGAMSTLDDLADSAALAPYAAVTQAIRGINSMQLQAQGTLGGELCQRPRCWFFRNGHGLLADRGRLVAEGDNRYHAILGNDGPAKFVHPSRVAPALVALGAQVRLAGPTAEDETILPIEYFFRIPRDESERETMLLPSQVLTHLMLPAVDGVASATYEVRQGAGPDYPLAAAAAALRFDGPYVREARIVLGHAAPMPWRSAAAERAMIGLPVTPETVKAAGEAAVAAATPLASNRYKVQLARVSVERALLMAAGLETGGF
ncbi:MAG: FAD binding domain-containing protein [Pirellulales bacterium]|nr:FAD binding domain-containing protein [Pirellulales bacterium]